MSTCSSQPLSWLLLERYQLGELPAPEVSRVEDHLAACATCRECLQQIRAEADLPLRPLAEIQAPATRPWTIPWLRRALAGAGAMAFILAAWYGIGLLREGAGHNGVEPPAYQLTPAKVLTKGGEIAINLIRERSGVVEENPWTFLPGDRFKVRLTCPPPSDMFIAVVVYVGGVPSSPLAIETIQCGNLVTLPGAFIIDEPNYAHVCAVLSGTSIDRSRLGTMLTEFHHDPGLEVVCAHLAPAKDR